MKLLFQYLKHHKKTLVWALFLAVINQVFSLLDPQIYRLLVDNYALKAGAMPLADFFRGVILLLLAFIGVAFVSRTAKSFQDYYVSVVTQRVGAELYETAVRHAFSLPYVAFEDQRSGELLQKLQKARQDAQAFIQGTVNNVFLPVVSIIFVLVYASTIHWAVGLAYFLIIPILGFTATGISRKIKAAQKQIVGEMSALAGSTTETLRNVELVKSLGLENQEADRLNSTTGRILGLELKKVRMVRTLMFIQGTTINAMRAAIIFLNLWLIWSGQMTLGEFFILMIYSFFIFTPLGSLGEVATQYQEARASMETLENVLKTEPEPVPVDATVPGPLEQVEFREVSFRYPTGQTDAVQGASFALERGTSIAFVGPSGSGKTTLVKLLVGLYHPSEGQIYVNNVSNDKVNFAAFRKRIGYVSQDTQLFAGTVRENLQFVRPDASDEECLNAIRSAAAEPIIVRGGQGLDTKIGEGGLKLSGGERQRIAIARALLRDPDLLIFDEATSALDSLTEREITDTIRMIAKTRPNLAVVLVAHRLSTVAHAGTILVLERGKIIERGKHEELLKQEGGLYAALWREQQAIGEG